MKKRESAFVRQIVEGSPYHPLESPEEEPPEDHPLLPPDDPPELQPEDPPEEPPLLPPELPPEDPPPEEPPPVAIQTPAAMVYPESQTTEHAGKGARCALAGAVQGHANEYLKSVWRELPARSVAKVESTEFEFNDKAQVYAGEEAFAAHVPNA